ncbi:UDP-N-acetylmuramoyl-L-alanine--D-glutamate ligase [Oleiphilus sp. HI0071]|uniref:UDP-N-acetylmuramoyl-L-alanine--D-glutamate ligase n=1 Tax=unclassified Oleiphilus TaxID=2631174 RepID=UPI0007C2E45D|nr:MULTISPECIES: UDP-N-acetylmuramoyl-L-alanine--D-glutamate ligase [unclassified Oleiphilus]KZY60231.1 UDP-N-acetylmuramoyl-L-alanine--D-glutamate ligase [Oleiphilus sp. HI0065]KZY82543.1 UDP-N-acetylmuramoyl-L-alanine--D-glutamate ligase [Oleiphilus sp. HI0071]KZY92882.1 UDP-N-acetylmuramoyl-L-alanine--D-glutamate ligase [Oleiphilus sp. HI0073]KZZ44751.1 UDP-N-acetylmuramoyl-L-alanine--D-glutamate ligase [Oleiphilus sp. HI0118]KZZ50697.1 UDP-N-acetylmuramoyl-L-alanine--D-glutamate ligase [Ol
MALIASDKHSYVVGLGETGLSCARFLAKLGRPFSMLDTRDAPPNLDRFKSEFPETKLVLGELEASTLVLADEIILSPGLDPKHPALVQAAQAGVKIRGDIDLFAEHANAPIAAITGSNGKSTVTVLLGDMAKEAGRNVRVGGNLGTPALDLIDENADLYVMELSSFQLELVEKLNADVACLLNISEDHMDRYASKLDYLQAKQRIFRGAKTVVVNDDEPLSQPLRAQDMKIVHYGMNGLDLNKFSYSDERLGATLMKGFEALVDVADLNMSGTHNFSNALAALAMGTSLGLPLDAMIRALKAFKGLDHRCEWVRQLDGVTYINDSKGTNGGACAAAIAGFGSQLEGDGKVVLIAGGEAKGALLTELKEPLARFGRSVIAFGADRDIVRAAVEGSLPVIHADSLHQAVTLAKEEAAAGDLVLFSPACASFDMFRNFEHRGDAFKAEVAKL